MSIREGDKTVTIPVAKAVIRSMAVNAAKGNTRAQKLFSEMLSRTEAELLNDKQQLFEAAVEYKQQWEKAIEYLTKETGKPAELFEWFILDLTNVASIRNAAVNFPEFDRILLNAGGFGLGKKHEESGIVDAMLINTTAHALLVDEMLKTGKLARGKGQWLVYVGSEVSL